MKRVLILFILLALASPCALRAQSLRFTRAVALGSRTGLLSWNSVPSARHYRLYRHYPDAAPGSFDLLALCADTSFADTLGRTICADTVSYRVEALLPDTLLRSDTAGLYYQDNVPTSPCSLRLCSVDTLLGRIRLSWYPSPDTDIMGYYICMGSPCRDYDTVWGRLNTSYLCREFLSPDSLVPEYSFRILAFDSCFQASPLTPYFHNPVLRLSADSCSRLLRFNWNRYVNMPDSLLRYTLRYRLNGEPQWRCHHAAPDAPRQFDTLVADLSVSHIDACLSVHNLPDTLVAFSQLCSFDFPYGDTAAYLSISSVSYDEDLPAAYLSISIDPLYLGPFCHLYRAAGDDGPFIRIADLPIDPIDPAPHLTYSDRSISRAAGSYRYFLAAPDGCAQRFTYSDTVSLLLPDVGIADAFFPNAIIFGDPRLGSFCPQYVSPLVAGYHLAIYDRRGERLFATDDLRACWDGTARSGQPLPQGTYIYHARCRHADGSERIYQGTVLLIK